MSVLFMPVSVIGTDKWELPYSKTETRYFLPLTPDAISSFFTTDGTESSRNWYGWSRLKLERKGSKTEYSSHEFSIPIIPICQNYYAASNNVSFPAANFTRSWTRIWMNVTNAAAFSINLSVTLSAHANKLPRASILSQIECAAWFVAGLWWSNL